MIVTINTDASFSRMYKRGAYAFWMVCNDFKIQKSGILRKQISRPEIAEAQCIINALHVLFNQDCRKITKVIINTDCLNAIHFLTDDKRNIKFYSLQFGTYLKNRMDILIYQYKFKPKIEFRHVKAHTTTDGARNWVNDWCDKNAKSQLQKNIKQIK